MARRLPGVPVAPRFRGPAWTEKNYRLIMRLHSKGMTAVEIANSLCLGVRGVKQHVAELNRANGTVRQRNHARRRETVAAYLLVNVRGGGTGKLRAMNMRELNKFIARKPQWRGTGYHATRRDCIACGLGRQAGEKGRSPCRAQGNDAAGAGNVGGARRGWGEEAGVGSANGER